MAFDCRVFQKTTDKQKKPSVSFNSPSIEKSNFLVEMGTSMQEPDSFASF